MQDMKKSRVLMTGFVLSFILIGIFLWSLSLVSAITCTHVNLYKESVFWCTSEDATCKFTTDNSLGCNSDFYSENITAMQGSLSATHSISWNAKVVHYIKCEDIWGNKPGTCSIIVQPEGPREISQETNQTS